MDFLKAAAPWLALGICIAIIAVNIVKKEQKQRLEK